MSDDNIRDSILREGILGNKNNIVKSFGAGEEDELEKAKRREYQVGEISPNTGLQKQPDGSWAPPKKGTQKKEPSHISGEGTEGKKRAIARIKDEYVNEDLSVMEAEEKLKDEHGMSSKEATKKVEQWSFEREERDASMKEAKKLHEKHEKIMSKLSEIEKLAKEIGDATSSPDDSLRDALADTFGGNELGELMSAMESIGNKYYQGGDPVKVHLD